MAGTSALDTGRGKVCLAFVALSLIGTLSYMSNFVIAVGSRYSQDDLFLESVTEVSNSTEASAAKPVVANVQYYTDKDGQMTFVVPRTTNRAYNDVSNEEKYFMYSPSGGFNNQRLELEFALRMAKVFNRTLVVPMAGKHSDLWRGYWYLPNEDLFPMDRIIDLEHMEDYGVKLLPLNISLSRFVDKVSRKYGKSNVTFDYSTKFTARERLGLHACDLEKQVRI